eukprot:12033022-Alexandrium_andersonii.AAC.1
MQHRVKRSGLELRGPEHDGSASFCALRPTVATRRARGRASGAFPRGIGRGSPVNMNHANIASG